MLEGDEANPERRGRVFVSPRARRILAQNGDRVGVVDDEMELDGAFTVVVIDNLGRRSGSKCVPHVLEDARAPLF